MAEIAAAALAIGSSVLKLSQVVHERAGSFLSVWDELERLKRELSWMKAFLKDAEDKLHSNNLVQQWVTDVRELACESEDVVDTFLFKIEVHKTTFSGLVSCGCFTIADKITLGGEIKRLLNRAAEISARRQAYGLQPIADDPIVTTGQEVKLRLLRRSTSYADDELFVGLAETILLLKDVLAGGGPGRFVVSIFGMGGLGKTTVARKLYNDLKRGEFECAAWVCVSQEFKPRDVLLELAKSLTRQTDKDLENKTTVESLEAHLRARLKNRQFLVVMDDVWENEVWESLKRALPDNNKASRVIITTRNEEVAVKFDNKSYAHKLRHLREDESWQLFSKKAFRGAGLICPASNLEKLGKEMVKKCGGLPLAIVVLSGLLSNKFHASEWLTVKDNLWKKLRDDSVHINAVLTLSFEDLRPELKPCFLYFGMFPEDYEVDVNELMLLWVAEGFISQEEKGRPEDVAKAYFIELVGRGFIQKRSTDWLDWATCQVHDLLRELAISTAKQINFCRYYDEQQPSDLTKSPLPRRLAANLKIPPDYTNHSLRTLAHLENWKLPDPKRLRLLRVLYLGSRMNIINEIIQWENLKVYSKLNDFSYYPLTKTTDVRNIGKLIHLRYLHLPLGTDGKLPDTIGNLKALETLMVGGFCPFGGSVKLPKAMKKLTNLRNLIGPFSNFVAVEILENLQTLGHVDGAEWCNINTTNWSNLRHLSIVGISEGIPYFSSKLDGFNHLASLRFLQLNYGFEGFLDDTSVHEILKRCPDITHLMLHGNTYTQSGDMDMFEFGGNLEVLQFRAYFQQDPMPMLGKIPSLRALQIEVRREKDYTGNKLVCSEGAFPQLQTLQFTSCFNMELVVPADGCMSLLARLLLNDCTNFTVPDRLKQFLPYTSV